MFKANTTLVVWLIFLTFGGGLLALYYARIGYLPDMEWSSSLVYLAAASVIGGGVGLLLALAVLLPGLIWSEFLVFDPPLVIEFCYDESGREPCLRTIMYWLGLPFGVVLLISHLALWTGVIWYVAISLVLLIITFFIIRRVFKSLLSGATEQVSWTDIFKHRSSKATTDRAGSEYQLLERRVFMYSSWFTLSVLLSQISMFVIYRLSATPTDRRFLVLTVICTAGVWISNHVVAVRYRWYPRQAVAASLVAAALLLFAADRFSPLSLRVMGYFGFGGDPKVSLLVTVQGADIIKKLELPNRCVPQTPESQTRESLCGVELLSKVGNEYYFSLEGRTFTLPKSAVLSIYSHDRRPK